MLSSTGSRGRTDCGRIKVSSRRNGAHLELVVEDDGRGVTNPRRILDNGGIGLRNVQKRLTQLYSDNFEFKLDSPGDAGFVATIVVPYETAEK